MAMIKILKLTPKQQGLVRQLNRIIKRFEEEGVGTIIQTYDVGFSCIRFYNSEKVVWSETELVEIGECEELSKQEYSGYCDREIAEKLQNYDKLTWCCPDPEEMYRIPFVSFVGEAPNPWEPVENRDIISFVIDKYNIDLFPIKEDGLYGYATEDGEVIFPCKWKEAKAFSEGYAAVMDENGMYGYIGKCGDVLIECEWKDAKPFKDGFAEVMDEDGEWYSINYCGKLYREGLTVVQGENSKYGYVDKFGELIIPYEWKGAWLFREGLAVVQDDNDKYGYIDKTGKLVIPCKWIDARDFYDGKADVVDANDLYFSIDKTGYSFSEGLAIDLGDNGKYGYVDSSKKLVIPYEWDFANDFKEGMAAVCDLRTGYGYINKNGELVIPCKWEEADDFCNGLATVKDENGNVYTIDKFGNVTSTEDSDDADSE